MRILELFTIILGFGNLNAVVEVYRPSPSSIVRRGATFVLNHT